MVVIAGQRVQAGQANTGVQERRLRSAAGSQEYLKV